MHLEPKRILPVILILVVGLIATAFVIQLRAATSNADTFSGTIEATEIHLASQIGGVVKRVSVKEGQPIKAGQELLEIYRTSQNPTGNGTNEKITSPINGVVLERLVEPGELALSGATLMTITDLDSLTLTVYVPEDRYGQIYLGQTYPVTVDSFPRQIFNGTVAHIADQAEFTPRNVQTTNSRKSTVFAIRLDLEPSGGSLKSGMPADVTFHANP